MSGAKERKRKSDVVSRGRPARAETEIALDFTGDNARGRKGGKSGRCDRAVDDGEQSFARLRVAPRFARFLSDDQDFRRGHAFGIGKIGMRDERAPKRNREEHAEHAAGRADGERFPERKTRPPADDHEARQHEDDGGERAGRRRDRLDDVVFDHRGVAERAQDRHRDDGCRDRGREGKPDFKTQVNIGRREDDRDEDAEDEPAHAEFDGICGFLGHGGFREGGKRSLRRRRRYKELSLPRLTFPKVCAKAA